MAGLRPLVCGLLHRDQQLSGTGIAHGHHHPAGSEGAVDVVRGIVARALGVMSNLLASFRKLSASRCSFSGSASILSSASVINRSAATICSTQSAASTAPGKLNDAIAKATPGTAASRLGVPAGCG